MSVIVEHGRDGHPFWASKVVLPGISVGGLGGASGLASDVKGTEPEVSEVADDYDISMAPRPPAASGGKSEYSGSGEPVRTKGEARKEAPKMIRTATKKGAKAKSAGRAKDVETNSLADRMAVVMDPAAKAANLLQIQRARGQVEGIGRMIEDERYCVDIIVQITAARASLQAVAKDLLNRHLKACHKAAMNNGGAIADEMYQELVDLVGKMAK